MESVATKKHSIDVNAASIVELKAELFRKQEEIKRQKLQARGEKPIKAKKPSVFEKRNHGIGKRAAKDAPDNRTTEEIEAEEAALRRARAKLEEKAALYELMSKGKQPSGSSEREDGYLVDFEQKQINRDERLKETQMSADEADSEPFPEAETPDEEWVEYTDSLGRSRRCLRKDLPHMQEIDKSIRPDQESSLPLLTERTLLSEDMKREMLRQKWEKEEEEMMQRQGPTHYENVRFDEVRSHGVGYYQFSKDEAQRQEQLKMLNQLREQTVEQRERREKIKAKRKAAVEARLQKVRQRKMKKTGESVTEPTNENIGEAEPQEPSNHPTVEVSNTTSDIGDSQKQDADKAAAKLEQDVFAMISSIRKEVDDAQAKDKKPVGRHWDAFRNQEDDRPNEFAPPTSYNKNTVRASEKQSSWQPGPNPIGAKLFGTKNDNSETSPIGEPSHTPGMLPSVSLAAPGGQPSLPGLSPFLFMPFPPPIPGYPFPFPPPGIPFTTQSLPNTGSVLTTQENGPVQTSQ